MGCIKLNEVCKGLALNYDKIGYVQGMNFIAGFFLLVIGFDAFESWNTIINFFNRKRNLYYGLFSNGLPVLKFLCYCLDKILQLKNPKLSLYLKQKNIPISLLTSKWFLSFFILNLETEYLLRVFDYLIIQDVFGMAVIAFILLNSLQKVLYRSSFDEIAKIVTEKGFLNKHLNYKKFCEDLIMLSLLPYEKINILRCYQQEIH